MNIKQFIPIAKKLADLSNFKYKTFALNDEYQNKLDFGNNYQAFIEALNAKCEKIQLALMRHSVAKERFEDLLDALEAPFLTFVNVQGNLLPIIFFKEGGETQVYVFNEHGYVDEIDEGYEYQRWLEQIHTENEQITYVLPFPLTSLVSDEEEKDISPVARLFKLFSNEKKDIFYIYFYALIIAVVNLSLPLGIQSILQLVSGGVIFNSIVILISFVILGVLVGGALQVMQLSIVEVLQRRLFTKAAFEFSYRLPRIRKEALLHHYAPELMNRFFEVVTLQKGLPKLLIDLAGAILQILFGMVLLSFYHPFFVFFGITVIAILITIFYFTGASALRSQQVVSKYKFKVAFWLQELARTITSFKLAGYTELPTSKTETLVSSYLYYRKKHFSVLMTQFLNIVAFKTLITGGLLIIGSNLVIDRQITLGQFVAAEIVIILILGAVEKIVLSMSTIYDMLVAVDKLGQITDMPLERRGGVYLPHETNKGMQITMKGLSYQYPDSNIYVLQDVNLDIQQSERICLAGYSGSGKNTLVKILSGILHGYQGSIAINGLPLRDINLVSLHNAIAKNVSMEELFDGTILENITMGRPSITYEDVLWAIENLGLSEAINSMPDGLGTHIASGGLNLSSSTNIKLILARCIAERPQILILNDFLHDLNKEERQRIIKFILDKHNTWTLISVSNEPLILQGCDRIILMNKGRVIEQGTYQTLLGNPVFQQVVADDDIGTRQM
jgi:ABC-type bacteriocin/lantibiotic exporter with double-glycine peptidase domain